MTTLEDIQKRFDAFVSYGRTCIFRYYPFYATVLSQTPVKLGPVTTACTDGVEIIFGHHFILTLSAPAFAGVLLHELKHILGFHLQRMHKISQPSPLLWNMATDIIINNDILQDATRTEGHIVLPEGALFDFQYLKHTAEEVYQALLEEQGAQGNAQDQQKPSQNAQGPEAAQETAEGKSAGGKSGQMQREGPGDAQSTGPSQGSSGTRLERETRQVLGEKGGDPLDGDLFEVPHNPEVFGSQHRNQIKQALEAGRKLAERTPLSDRHAGTLGHDMELVLEALFSNRLPWEHLLLEYVTEHFADYSYCPPDYSQVGLKLWRQGGRQIYVPRITGTNLRIALGVDTSGSVSEDELRKIVGQAEDIVTAFDNVEITVYMFDTEVKKEFLLSAHNLCEIQNMVGRGGTDFRPVIEKAAASDQQLLVIFTDSFGPYPSVLPAMDLLWVMTTPEYRDNRRRCPYGRELEMFDLLV